MTLTIRSSAAAVAAAAAFSFLCLGTAAAAQAAPHAALVAHGAGQAQGHLVYQTGPGHWQHPETAHRPRPGHFWVAGHWQQRGPRAVWQPGHWERSRPAHRPHYGAAHYPNGPYGQPPPPRWDRDGDGVPNRHDRRPNNPYRY